MDTKVGALPTPALATSPLQSKSRTSRKTLAALAALAVILICHAPFHDLLRRFNEHRSCHTKPRDANPHNRTVILVSIDGFRADYVDKGLTPHLVAHGKGGIRAEWMRPIFPTLTFPNHWALLTGLYAESHGIIANTFWDPVTDAYFDYSNRDRSWGAHWWWGEPIWATAERAGIRTANLMWPGPPETSAGIKPTYFIPWRNQVPLTQKLAQIDKWLALPQGQRPQLILMYDPAVDQAGHSTGPDSPALNRTLEAVDAFARDLPKDVDVIFVSDHGMTDTSHQRLLFLDHPDLLGKDARSVVHWDGWPAMGLRFSENADIPSLVARLEAYADAHPGRFRVFNATTMLDRWHFSPLRNARIAPVWIVPELGWGVGVHTGGTYPVKGNHGFDNAESSMRAMMVAGGPSFSAHSGSVLPHFQNVEIYGLVARLLGIEGWRASNNGTTGFWDTWIEA